MAISRSGRATVVASRSSITMSVACAPTSGLCSHSENGPRTGPEKLAAALAFNAFWRSDISSGVRSGIRDIALFRQRRGNACGQRDVMRDDQHGDGRIKSGDGRQLDCRIGADGIRQRFVGGVRYLLLLIKLHDEVVDRR